MTAAIYYVANAHDSAQNNCGAKCTDGELTSSGMHVKVRGSLDGSMTMSALVACRMRALSQYLKTSPSMYYLRPP